MQESLEELILSQDPARLPVIVSEQPSDPAKER